MFCFDSVLSAVVGSDQSWMERLQDSWMTHISSTTLVIKAAQPSLNHCPLPIDIVDTQTLHCISWMDLLVLVTVAVIPAKL